MKKKERRMTTITVLVLTAVLALSGCGKSKSAGTGTGTGSGAAETVVQQAQEAPLTGIGTLTDNTEAKAEDFSEYYKKMGVTLDLPAGYTYQATSVANDYSFIHQDAQASVSVISLEFANFDGHRIFVYNAADFVELASTGADWWTDNFSLPESMKFGSFSDITVDGREGYLVHGEGEGTKVDMYFFDTLDAYGVTVLYTVEGFVSTHAEELADIVKTAAFTDKPACAQDIDYYSGGTFHLVSNNQNLGILDMDEGYLILYSEEPMLAATIMSFPLGELSESELEEFNALKMEDYLKEVLEEASFESEIGNLSEATEVDGGRVRFIQTTGTVEEDGEVAYVAILFSNNESRWQNLDTVPGIATFMVFWKEQAANMGEELLDYIISSYVLGADDQSLGTDLPVGDETDMGISGNTDHSQEYTGFWWDTYSQRCHMEIKCEDGVNYEIDINWADSASENTHWVFRGTYDEEAGGIRYQGSMIKEVYPDNGEMQETYIYEDGEGLIRIGDDSMLYWDDYVGRQGANCVFEKG